MPSTSKEQYRICARLHPVDENGTPDLNYLFLEGTQSGTKAGRKVITTAGVCSFDKVVCTIDLYNLHLDAHIGLNCVVIETEVDSVQIGRQLYYPHSLIERNNVAISPMCHLRKSRGLISLRIVADIMRKDGSSHSSDYNLLFQYDKTKGSSPTPLSDRDRRYIYQPLQEDNPRIDPLRWQHSPNTSDTLEWYQNEGHPQQKSIPLLERIGSVDESQQVKLASRISSRPEARVIHNSTKRLRGAKA